MDKAIHVYADAITLLNSTQTGYKALEERRKAGKNLGQEDPIGQMRTWLGYIGYQPRDLDRLNVVHVAGTKGKGTTCAFTNSILERYRLRRAQSGKGGASNSLNGPSKIGLFTSPHLVAVRERIRINSEPISEEAFTHYFFEVWSAFETAAKAAGQDPAIKPSYFRFLTLMSYHVFMREGVDTAIYEVGVGGELDATNVFVAPAATAITTLGIDHVLMLGDTIDKIAWHKAGIMKDGCPAFTIPQDPEAMKVLQERAAERHTPLTILEPSQYEKLLAPVKISPNEAFQHKNAAVAIELSATVLRRLGVDVDLSGDSPLPDEFVDGLENTVWRGRCETKVTGRQKWYLDGAHNEQSLNVACRWFGRVLENDSKGNANETPNVLIFNQQSTRDAIELLNIVHKTVYDSPLSPRFQYAIFCTNVTFKNNSWKVDFVNKNVDPKALKSLELQQELASVWKTLDPNTEVQAMPTIEDAIDFVRSINGGEKDVRVLITGSFHLIGGALSILEGEDFALGNTSAS